MTKPSVVPPVPKIPDIPEISVPSKVKTKHARQKSSVSSRKFLPKDWLSQPLSEDPQIRALASPPGSPEIEAVFPSKDEVNDKNDDSGSAGLIPNLPSPPAPTASPAGRKSSDDARSGSSNSNGTGIQTRRRSMTAPGNPPPVLPPVPLMVRKSRTSYINPNPRSIHHPHHPNFVPATTITPKTSPDAIQKPPAARPSLAPVSKSIQNINNNKQPLQRHKSTSTSTRLPPHRQLSMGHHPPTRFPPTQPSLAAHGSIKDLQRARSSSSSYRNNQQFPRRTPSLNQRLQQPHYQHYLNQYQHHNQHNMMHAPAQTPQHPLRPTYTRRFHSNDGRGFDPARTLPPIPRSDDTATLYPSTRRPRSSIYGGIPNVATTSNSSSSSNPHEAIGVRRMSLSLADGGVALEGDREIVERRNTYRGAERTSFCAPAVGGVVLG